MTKQASLLKRSYALWRIFSLNLLFENMVKEVKKGLKCGLEKTTKNLPPKNPVNTAAASPRG